MKLFFSIFITLSCVVGGEMSHGGYIAECSFKDWLTDFQYSNKTLCIDIIDKSRESHLKTSYYLEWQANCLVLISEKNPDIVLKIPLLVSADKSNCGDLDGELIYDHLSCRFNGHFSRIVNGKVDMSFELVNKENKVYKVVHTSSDNSKRIYMIGLKEGYIEMETISVNSGKIPMY